MATLNQALTLAHAIHTQVHPGFWQRYHLHFLFTELLRFEKVLFRSVFMLAFEETEVHEILWIDILFVRRKVARLLVHLVVNYIIKPLR